MVGRGGLLLLLHSDVKKKSNQGFLMASVEIFKHIGKAKGLKLLTTRSQNAKN